MLYLKSTVTFTLSGLISLRTTDLSNRCLVSIFLTTQSKLDFFWKKLWQNSMFYTALGNVLYCLWENKENK